MPMKISVQTADAMLTALAGLCNAGTLIIYSGTVPATATTALSGNTVLAQLGLSATAFNTTTSVSGSTAGLTTTGQTRVMTAFPITADSSADATGDAAFFRIYDSSGTATSDVVYQGTCASPTGGDLNLNAIGLIQTGTVSISSLTVTQPLE